MKDKINKIQHFFFGKSDFTANAMSPLYVPERQIRHFDYQLKEAKHIGIDAISVDIWWGLVCPQKNTYDWSYYDRIFDMILSHGLKIMPLISFHACGTNVGDEYFQPLPDWLWESILQNYSSLQANDLKFVSEEGTANDETISLWADRYAMPYYEDFLRNFALHFERIAPFTQEINIGCGAAGELRYPSYNYHDGGAYPNRGRLQCYSRSALLDFWVKMQKKYRNIDSLNKAWDTKHKKFEDIQMPKYGHFFFEENQYRVTQYGIDLINWYNESLIEHGRRMIEMAIKILDNTAFSKTHLGIKIPGIHWRIADPKNPRTAEITAGLIPSIDNSSTEDGFGYKKLINGTILPSWKKRVILHFTCLEMGDNEGKADAYSKAESLVFWVGNAAKSLGITLKGENALADGVKWHDGWDKIDNAVQNAHYQGLTILRIGEVTQGIGQKRYQKLISHVKASPFKAWLKGLFGK